MTNKSESYLRVLHYMFLEFLNNLELMEEAAKEVRDRWDMTLVESMVDDDTYLHHNPNDDIRSYASHITCIPLHDEHEWNAIERSFREAIPQVIKEDNLIEINEGLLEFFDVAVSPIHLIEPLHAVHPYNPKLLSIPIPSFMEDAPISTPPSSRQIFTDMVLAQNRRRLIDEDADQLTGEKMLKAARAREKEAEVNAFWERCVYPFLGINSTNYFGL